MRRCSYRNACTFTKCTLVYVSSAFARFIDPNSTFIPNKNSISNFMSSFTVISTTAITKNIIRFLNIFLCCYIRHDTIRITIWRWNIEFLFYKCYFPIKHWFRIVNWNISIFILNIWKKKRKINYIDKKEGQWVPVVYKWTRFML